MDDIEDIQLKNEMDEIMQHVNNIMKKIESLIPPTEEEPTQEEN